MMQKSDQSNNRKPVPYKITGKRAKVAGVLCLVILSVVLFMMSPIFDIEKIEVEGNIKIVSEDIIKASGLKKGENIFSFDTSDVEKRVTSYGKISSVRVTRALPSKVIITVDEASVCAYIKENNAYTGIDEKGMVVLTLSAQANSAPVIQGIKIRDSENGQYIHIESAEAKFVSAMITKILTALERQSILSRVRIIDISNINDIRFTLDNETLVIMGKGDDDVGRDINYKIAVLKGILAEEDDTPLPDVINMTDPDKIIGSML